MKIVVLQHSQDTPPGTVIDWVKQKNYDLDVRRLFAGDKLPLVAEVDWLIILGGPMNVDQHAEYPWLVEEKTLLKEAIAKGTTCLGLCLGGQLLAQTLGAQVTPHTHWEIGWHPIELENGEKLVIFQWHQDTFQIPKEARRIATNTITPNQGFAYGDHVIGFQFHPETTEKWVHECMIENPYPAGPYVQSPELLREGLVYLSPMTEWFFRLLDKMEARTLARL